MTEQEIKKLDEQVRNEAQRKYLTYEDIARILKKENKKQTFVEYIKKYYDHK